MLNFIDIEVSDWSTFMNGIYRDYKLNEIITCFYLTASHVSPSVHISHCCALKLVLKRKSFSQLDCGRTNMLNFLKHIFKLEWEEFVAEFLPASLTWETGALTWAISAKSV